MPPSPPPAPAASASAAAMLRSVRGVASYSDTLADFLDQWNSVILDVASIAATFAVLFPGPESHPKPLPAAADPAPEPPEREPSPAAPEPPEREPSPAAPEPSEREPSPAAPEPDLNLAPEPEGPEPNAVPEPEPSPKREPAPDPAPEPAPNPTPEPAPVPKPAPNPGREPSAAELEHRCKQMNFRELRRFVTAHVRDREWLRKVGPAALRRAEDPASLVLRTIGRYYICAESGDAEAACLLLLELYVRAGCPCARGRGDDAEAQLRHEAREAALTWRSRILRVKGRVSLADAGAREARGLAFFMAAFGVPLEFPAQDLYDLLVAADIAACTKVLKCSKHFVKKMGDVVVEMINKDMHLQAIRIILEFELQNAFPVESTLTHIMEKFDHARKDDNEGQASERDKEERDEEELTLLRSISKCMEDHELLLSEFPSFAERIALLEERVGKPKPALAGIKRKRTTEEDCVD